jgi:hypothetical protein
MKNRFAWFGIGVGFLGFVIALAQNDRQTAGLLAACITATVVGLILIQKYKPN